MCTRSKVHAVFGWARGQMRHQHVPAERARAHSRGGRARRVARRGATLRGPTRAPGQGGIAAMEERYAEHHADVIVAY